MTHRGKPGHAWIDGEHYVEFPYHPRKLTNSVGVGHWEDLSSQIHGDAN